MLFKKVEPVWIPGRVAPDSVFGLPTRYRECLRTDSGATRSQLVRHVRGVGGPVHDISLTHLSCHLGPSLARSQTDASGIVHEVGHSSHSTHSR